MKARGLDEEWFALMLGRSQVAVVDFPQPFICGRLVLGGFYTVASRSVSGGLAVNRSA
jgi:hypothetical protein